MAANLANHIPIVPIGSISGNQPRIEGYSEKATQTFKGGTPVMLSGGFMQAWDGTTVAAGILGVGLNAGSNLGSSGKGAPGAFTGVGAPGTGTTFGSVPFQTSAVNIPHGAPAVDGRNLAAIANADTLFLAQVDNNTGANFTLLQADIGSEFGMTVDANGWWYVDRAKTTVGTNTVVVIVNTWPNSGLVANALVVFKFIETAWQLPG